MSKLESFVTDFQYYLTQNSCEGCNIIRKHSKKLEQLGDVSFPININNWHQLLDNGSIPKDALTIFDYINKGINLEQQCNKLKEATKNWSLIIDKISVIAPNAHIFLKRSPVLFVNVLEEVLCIDTKYGLSKCLYKNYEIKTCDIKKDIVDCDLTVLRLDLLKKTANSFINEFSQHNTEFQGFQVKISLSHKCSNGKNVLCGPVLNEKGMKTLTTTGELYK